jgi:hypothetical protein
MKTVSKTICEIVEIEYNVQNQFPITKRVRHVWKIIKHPDKELIGEIVTCGLPSPSDYPIGTRHITTIEIPE